MTMNRETWKDLYEDTIEQDPDEFIKTLPLPHRVVPVTLIQMSNELLFNTIYLAGHEQTVDTYGRPIHKLYSPQHHAIKEALRQEFHRRMEIRQDTD